jgi:alpha-tubulin suppressor-like RCC1 family protein
MSRKVIFFTLSFLILASLMVFAPTFVAHAATCTVTTEADSGPGSLRAKIADASCDTIYFDDDYTILLTNELTIARDVTIDGQIHAVTISGNNAVRVFSINSGLTFTLQNLTIENGRVMDGSGGGIISTNSTVNITNTVFSNHTTRFAGGAIKITNGMLTITNSVFSNNNSSVGGAISASCSGIAHSCGSILTITDSTFSANNGYDGGAVVSDWDINITRSVFSSNQATIAGGAIYFDLASVLTVTDSTFTDNTARWGGAIYNDVGRATVTNTTFTGNMGEGHSIYNASDPELISQIRGELNVVNCTFFNNETEDAGGIYNSDYSVVTITNSTFSANKGYFPGIYNEAHGTLFITNSTFSDNMNDFYHPVEGSAIFNIGTATVINSIFANNTYAGCIGTFNDGGGNIYYPASDTTCPGVFGDPQLGTLGNYGGGTQTISLLPGSAAIDGASTYYCPTTDQRGITRGATCDSGAFESRGFTLTKLNGDNQSTNINTAFDNPLAVMVNETGGNVLPGAIITFVAPTSGASIAPPTTVTTATNSGGVAAIPIVANSVFGSYPVTAYTNGIESVTFWLTNKNTSVSAGGYHTCGLKEDGTLQCWGVNGYGQTTVPSPNTNWAQVNAGGYHTCGLKADGTLRCWGRNDFGQSTIPAPNTSWVQVATGEYHTCGLKVDGTLQCWGRSNYGQTSVPAPNANWMQVSTGVYHTCGLKTDGTLQCWGNNPYGQTVVPSPNANWAQVSAGYGHTCGLRTDGVLQCWGYNSDSQNWVPSPNANWAQVRAGYYHTCGLKTDGTVQCWGGNNDGQATIPNPNANWAQISTGYHHTCALKADNTLRCWGRNTSGQAPVITLVPNTLPNAALNTAYSQNFTASGGSATPYTFSTVAGATPTGLTLDANGTWSGAPTMMGTFDFTVQARDANNIATIRDYTLVVDRTNTTTTLASSQNPSVLGQSVTLTAVVAGSAGTPTGGVAFQNGGVTISGCGAQALNGSGQATCTISTLAIGAHSLTAVYSGDTNYNGSTSATVAQVVNRASTTTTLSSSANPSTYSSAVTLTAVVAGSSGTPTGSVAFQNGGVTISGCGAQALNGSGQATCTISTLAIGAHSLTAVYSGDTNYNGSTSATVAQVVNRASTTTTLSSSANPSAYGSAVTLTAVVAGSSGTPTGSVAFQNGGVTISGCGAQALNGSGQATCVTSALAVGTHSLTAVYGGDTSYNGSTSEALSQVVNCATAVTVQNAHDSGAGSLRQAIADVCAGGTITFNGDMTILLDDELVLDKDLTIDGETHAVTVSGNDVTRVFNATAGHITLAHLTIADGHVTTDDCGGFSNRCGGGLILQNSSVAVTVLDSTFSGNQATWDGGGIYNYYGTLTVETSTFSDNQATSGGGGIYNYYGTLTVETSTFSGNQADYRGGGIANGSGTLTVQDSIFSGNQATDGGGIYNSYGTLTVETSTFSGNQADYGGGGIYNSYGTLTVETSTFSGNQATYYGGGIYNYSASGSCASSPAVTIRNSTLSGNSATTRGGGIYNRHGVLELTVSTLTANTAPAGQGGGVFSYNDESTCTRIGHSLIAGNVGSDVAARETAQRYYSLDNNVIGVAGDNVDFSQEFNQTHDQTNVTAPLLAPLADYGGPTLTHALLPGSPAIDAGAASCTPATDQRGQPRDDWRCDIGAFEARLSDLATVSKPISGAGTYTFGPTLARIEVTNTGGCLTGLQVQRVAGNHPNATTPLQTGAYWAITPTGCTEGFATTLTLPFAQANDTSRLCRWLEGAGSGAGWDCDDETASHTTFVANRWVIRSNVTSFSDWAVGNDVGPTAVTLSSFSATSQVGWLAGWLVGVMAMSGLGGWLARKRR